MTMKRTSTCLVALILMGILMMVWGCEMHKKEDPTLTVIKSTTPAERATLQTQRMVTKVNLTEEQIPQVHQINMDTATKTQAVALSDDSEENQLRAIELLRAQKDKALRGILTEVQLQSYEMMKRTTEANLK